MKEFDFYYGLLLSQRLYALIDNLSKTLQNKNMLAISGQRLARLTLSTLASMCNDRDANLFFQIAVQKAEKHVEIKEPELPRQEKKPTYDVLQYVDGYDANGEEHQHKTPDEKYRQVYFEALDLFVVSLQERFKQPAYTIYANIEQLLLTAVNEEELYRDGLADIEQYYTEDIDLISLETEFHLLANLCKNTQILCFNDLLKVLKAAPVERKLIPNVVLLCMILYVSPATSATAERSFSLARRIKTWTQSTMSQKRFNDIAILTIHKELTDKLDLLSIGNEFVSKYDEQKRTFGRFIEKDFGKE